jgi:hypothetical protein
VLPVSNLYESVLLVRVVVCHRFDQMFIHTGFCIESRDDDEMPETLVGCAALNKPSPANAVPFAEA